jgi:hypothetical protein
VGLLLVEDEQAAKLREPSQRPLDHTPAGLVPLWEVRALVADGDDERDVVPIDALAPPVGLSQPLARRLCRVRSRSSSGSEMSVSAPERRADLVAYRVQLQALQRGVIGEGPARQGDASA